MNAARGLLDSCSRCLALVLPEGCLQAFEFELTVSAHVRAQSACSVHAKPLSADVNTSGALSSPLLSVLTAQRRGKERPAAKAEHRRFWARA